MRLETHAFTALDGVQLFVRSYCPDVSDPAKVIFWVHGVGEHGGRHEHMAEFFAQRGWRMIVADLRGHGRSGGPATHVASFDHYIDDIALIWQRMELDRIAPTLLGHSMGGLVAVRAVQSKRINPSALVLSSPLLGLKLRVNPFTKLLGRMLVRFHSKARFSNGIDPANMTRDSEFAAKRRSDPFINKTVTAGWFFAMQAALAAAQRDAALVEIPVLAIQGESDRTTDPAALANWWDRIHSPDKKLILLADHIHELFFESDWSATAAMVVDWLDERIKASSRHPIDGNSA